MSGLGGIVRMPSPDEIAAGGSVVPFRHGSPPVEPELGPVSPELALVDPELARAARERLPDPPRPVPVVIQDAVAPVAEQPAAVERLRRLEPIPEPASEPPPRRRRIRLGLLASAAGVIAAGVLLTLFVGREEQPDRRAQQTQSVAAAVSPPEASPTQPKPAATTPAKPAGTSTAPATSGPVHATAVPGKTFVWVTSPDAAAYEFQLFEGGERIFRARVDEARLELPGRWRQAGRPHALQPGNYRWYVWTISKRTKSQSTKPTVSAKLVVEQQRR
jgi:hypothetical protein